MKIFKSLKDVLIPALNLVDDLHLTEEEKRATKIKLLSIQNDIQSKVLSYEAELVKAQQRQVEIELTNKDWLQRNWRPITMLVFLSLIVLDSFKVLPGELNESVWSIVKFGLSGYVVGRSVEKTVGNIMRK
jgi:hypothetical protein